MKIAIWLSLMLLLFNPVLFSQHQTKGSNDTQFTPLAIEKTHSFTLRASSKDVFDLMSPQNGNHWTPATPKYMFGSDRALTGSIWRQGEAWMVVAAYDAQNLFMRSLLYIPDTELMTEDVRCIPISTGETRIDIRWCVAGISTQSNAAVQGFFDQYWDKRMQNIEQTYKKLLHSTTSKTAEH